MEVGSGVSSVAGTAQDEWATTTTPEDDGVEAVSRFLLIPEMGQNTDPDYKKMLEQLRNLTGGGNSTSSSDVSVRARDYTRCGVFPACSVASDDNGGVTVTCDRTLVSIALAAIVVVSIIIVVTNLLIVAVIARTRSLRKPQGYFKLSLAFAGLIYAGVFMASVAYNLNNKIYFDGRDLAQIFTLRNPNFSATVNAELVGPGRPALTPEPDSAGASTIFAAVGVFTSVVTLFSLLLLSIDGYVSVRWPMQYRSGDVMTRRRALVALAAVWLLALLLSFMPMMATNWFDTGLLHSTFMYVPVLEPVPNAPAGISKFWHGIAYAALVWGIPFAATWTLTILMTIQSRGILKHMRTARRLSHKSATRAFSKVDRELHVTIFVILSLFTITVLPVAVALLAVVVVKPPTDRCLSAPMSAALFAVFVVYTLGSFVNVVVYNVFHKEFRDATRKLLLDVARRVLVCPALDGALPYYSSRRTWSNGFAGSTLSSYSRRRAASNFPSATLQVTEVSPAHSTSTGVVSDDKARCESCTSSSVFTCSNDDTRSLSVSAPASGD